MAILSIALPAVSPGHPMRSSICRTLSLDEGTHAVAAAADSSPSTSANLGLIRRGARDLTLAAPALASSGEDELPVHELIVAAPAVTPSTMTLSTMIVPVPSSPSIDPALCEKSSGSSISAV